MSLVRLLLSGAALASLVGCLGSGTGSGGSNDSSCTVKVEKSIEAARIQGGHHLYFDSDAIAVLRDPNFTATSIVLSVELEKKSTKKEYEIQIGLNGIQAARPDGSKRFDGDDSKRPGRKLVRVDNLRVNGGQPIAVFVSQILMKKGEVKLSVQGSDVHVTAGSLEINGYVKQPCPKPTPTPVPSPTPVPVAPKVSIQSVMPQDSLTSQTNMNVQFVSDQNGVTFLCSLDDAPAAVCASPVNYSGLANGAHVFSVKARNAQGLESDAALHGWSVDTVAPVVVIDAVASPTSQTALNLSFSSSEAGVFTCLLDNVPVTPCLSPYQVSGLGEGEHTFEVGLSDNAGNLAEAAKVRWVVDVRAPTVQIVETVPAESPSALTSREIKFVADESATFECALDDSSFAACVSPYVLENLSEGNHLVRVRATDAAMNRGGEATVSWVTDLTPPRVEITSSQPAAGKTNASEFRVEFLASEASSFLCRVGAEEEKACSSPFTGTFADDGDHGLEIVAVDLAGLRSQAASIAWNVDRSAPEIRFGEILPSASAYVSTERLEVHVVAPERIVLSASFDGGQAAEVESPIVLEALSEGAHQLVVTGKDEFGNGTNTITHEFLVDRTAPVLTVQARVSGGALTNTSSNSFVFSASEETMYDCELDGAGFASCVSPMDVSGLIEGEHVMRVLAKDNAGNESPVQDVRWIVDTVAPVTSLSTQQTGAKSFVFTFGANEAAAGYVCSLDAGSEFACASPLSLTLETGKHVLKVQAVDAAGNRDPVGASTSVEVREPITTSLTHSGVVYTNQTSMAFSFSSNYANATFLCSLDGAAATPCSSPISYSGLGNGSHSFKVQAVDSTGQVDPNGASHAWTVDTVSPVIMTSSTSSNTNSITVNWTMNEPATGRLMWGLNFDTSNTSAESGFSTSQSITLSGLRGGTLYSVQITGRDQAGNVYVGQKMSIRTR